MIRFLPPTALAIPNRSGPDSCPLDYLNSHLTPFFPFLIPFASPSHTEPISPCTRIQTRLNHHTGTYNCIGKPLALLALRTSLAKLVLNFDISFAPNEDGTAFEKEARTQFTTRPGPLHLKFWPRRI